MAVVHIDLTLKARETAAVADPDPNNIPEISTADVIFVGLAVKHALVQEGLDVWTVQTGFRGARPDARRRLLDGDGAESRIVTAAEQEETRGLFLAQERKRRRGSYGISTGLLARVGVGAAVGNNGHSHNAQQQRQARRRLKSLSLETTVSVGVPIGVPSKPGQEHFFATLAEAESGMCAYVFTRPRFRPNHHPPSPHQSTQPSMPHWRRPREATPSSTRLSRPRRLKSPGAMRFSSRRYVLIIG